MLRRGALVLIVAAVCGSASAFAAAPDGEPTAVASGQRTWAKFSGARLYRPSTLGFGAHELITSITWSKWRRKLAIGHGTYHVNDCIPYCAAGTVTPTPATIYLTGRMRCGKRFIFRRLKVYFAGRKRSSPPWCKR